MSKLKKGIVIGSAVVTGILSADAENKISVENSNQDKNLHPTEKGTKNSHGNPEKEVNNVSKKADYVVSAKDFGNSDLALLDADPKAKKKKKKNKNQEKNTNQVTQTEARPAPRTLAEKNEYLNKVISPKLTTLRLQTAWPGYSEAKKAKAREELKNFRGKNKFLSSPGRVGGGSISFF